MLLAVVLALSAPTLAVGIGSSASWPQHPKWSPTYSMARSSVMMPCNTSGWFDSELAARYGIADFDWSNARALWANSAGGMDCSAKLVEQAAKVKAEPASSPTNHVWVYRNLVKALSWYKPVAEKLADPAYAGWFLHFRPGGATDLINNTWHSPPCTTLSDPPAGGAAKPSMVQEPGTNCLTSACAVLHNSSTDCPNYGATATAAACSAACKADATCAAYTWHAPAAPNPVTWQRQCFFIKQGVSFQCYPEALHDSGRKAYGRVCSDLYHSQDQTPQHPGECVGDCSCHGVPCGEYVWDHRNASLREWLVREHVMGVSSGGTDGMANPNISGFYFDDYWAHSGEGWSDGPMAGPIRPFNQSDCGTGPSEFERNCLLDMGLTKANRDAITVGWRQTTAAAMEAVYEAGGWVWQMFSGCGFSSVSTGPACVAAFENACMPGSRQQTRMCYFDLKLADPNAPGSIVDAASDVAKFLLARGPFAFLGTGWVGCAPDDGVEGGGHNQTYVRPAEFDVDYGEPTGLCVQTTPGVFVRHWTKATVSHDCSSGRSSIAMKTAARPT
jgi:hypothetical protein